MSSVYYAHTSPERDESAWDRLEYHLEVTAVRAGGFARAYAADAAYLIGLWHDIGKYQPEFQSYLRRSSAAGHAESDGIRGPQHSIIGAQLAYHRLNRSDLALCIAAHHGALASWAELRGRVDPPPPALPVPSAYLTHKCNSLPPPEAAALWIRFLFSALVDADSLETELWDRGVPRVCDPSTPPQLLERLERHLSGKSAGAPPTGMNLLRADVQAACRRQAESAPGAFRLTVPTGGGKTLASMLFALRHAVCHGLRRVIVVIPYTSIIEQTAAVYREIFGSAAVLEHHSSLDPEKESLANRHAVENWDSPIVVTTSVQFFETLHANRKRSLRKLHNVAESVVVLDEVQTFPIELIKPISLALPALSRHFRVTTLHCSATQPLLAQPEAREVVPDPVALFARTRGRVRVEWPDPAAPPVSWEALAAEIRQHPAGQVLAIVHSRKDAIELARAVGPACVHLSTLLCPQHRKQVLEAVRQRVSAGEPCLVVSTQLVEAGVDIDFPVVFRALAGVDSLAQAAGRCNREGRRPFGEFHIFLPPTEPPAGTLRLGQSIVRRLWLAGEIDDLFSPDLPARYFAELKELVGGASEIPALEKRLDFPKTAERFRMVADHGTPVVAPFGSEWLELIESVRRFPAVATFRRLNMLTVNLPTGLFRALEGQGALVPLLAEERESWCVLPAHANTYSEQFGFGGSGADGLPFMEA